MGLDLYIKRRMIKEEEEIILKKENLQKRRDKNTREFIKTYKVENLEELKKFPLQEVLLVAASLEEASDELWEEMEPLWEAYRRAQWEDTPRNDTIRIHSFFEKFYYAVIKENQEIDIQRSELDKISQVTDKEIFYARKDYHLKGFLLDILLKDSAHNETIESFEEVEFEEKDFIEFTEKFNCSYMQRYLPDFKNENIKIYGMIWE